MSNIKKNLGFQTAYQILATVMPIITSPYLSRTLGAAKLGVFSYTFAVVQAFVLAAMLGTVNYGTRSIAACKDDSEKCGRTFINIYALQAITSILATAAYALWILAFCKEDYLIAWIQLLYIPTCLLDINWLFFGLENFKITITRNFLVKIISFLLLFAFVRNENDLWKYTLLIAGSNLASQLVLWKNLPPYCRHQKIDWRETAKTIKPNLILFVPQLAMSVYHIMDKAMLGAISTAEESGFYYNADKLISIPLTIIGGFGTVLLPRMTNLIEKGEKQAADKVFLASLEGTVLTGAAMAFGIAAVANEFVPLFFGENFSPCIVVTILLAPTLLLKGISNTVRTEYLIPYCMESHLTMSVTIGAVVNFLVNVLLIPNYGAKGAAIGTICAEAAACCIQVSCVISRIKVGKSAINSGLYIISGLFMVVVVRKVATLFSGGWGALLVEVVIGGMVYLLLCFLIMLLTKSSLVSLLKKDKQKA